MSPLRGAVRDIVAFLKEIAAWVQLIGRYLLLFALWLFVVWSLFCCGTPWSCSGLLLDSDPKGTSD